jgi:hypothetical protein
VHRTRTTEGWTCNCSSRFDVPWQHGGTQPLSIEELAHLYKVTLLPVAAVDQEIGMVLPIRDKLRLVIPSR